MPSSTTSASKGVVPPKESRKLQTLSILAFVIVLPLACATLLFWSNPSSEVVSSSSSLLSINVIRHGVQKQLLAPENTISLSFIIQWSRQEFSDPSLARVVNLTGTSLQSSKGLLNHTELLILSNDERFFYQYKPDGHIYTVFVRDDHDPAGTDQGRSITLKCLHEKPRVFLVQGLVSEEEIDYLVEKGGEDLFESMVGEPSEEKPSKRKETIRNSQQQWFGSITGNEDVMFERLRRRASLLTRMPFDLAEDVQLLRYDADQHYFSHHDWIQKWTVPNNTYYKNGGNRLLTVLVYLSDVEEGGHTVFPMTNSSYAEYTHPEQCEPSFECLKVYPKKGDAVFWYNLEEDGHMDGKVDKSTLHAGCDVKKGVKWACNVWIRNKRVNGKLVCDDY